MMGIFRSAELSFAAAASFMLLLAGCAAPETVSRDVHVKRGVTAEDDLINFYGAPSQRIIRGDSEYFVYNARTMNITSADGSSCRGTPVFIFSSDTKKLSDLKCRESIPPEELSNRAGDSIVVGVTDSGNAPMYDASTPETAAGDGSDIPALAPAAGIAGADAQGSAGVSGAGSSDAPVPVEDLGSGESVPSSDSGTGSGSAEAAGTAGSESAGDEGASGSGDEIPLAGDDGEMQIINR